MVKSLDGLISFLLNEISFCGEEGARPCDFIEYVNNYYTQSSEEAKATTAAATDNVPASTRFAVDRPFLEQVWNWLVQHPEIRVGKNGEGNKLSLSQVEASFQKDTGNISPENALQRINSETQQESLLGSSVTRSAHPARIKGLDQKQAPPKRKEKSAMLPASVSEYRLYTTEARAWQAIAGHGPDYSRIQPLEFQCLSIISSRRNHGILQSDLVKISDQDKRSVPKRTDLLAAGGYIDKRPVLTKGMKTSLLYAKRFAPGSGPLLSDAISSQCSSGGSQTGGAVFIDYRTVYDAILDILREPRIVTIIDCKERLDSLQTKPSKSMWKSMIGRMAQIGLIRKVYARAHHEDRAPGRRMACLKLLRDPVERDWETFMVTSIAESTVNDGAAAQDREADNERHSNASEQIGTHSAIDVREPSIQQLEENTRMPPQWRSEKGVDHMLFETVNASGTQGISTMDLQRLTFGGNVVKPVERLLQRLVNYWQLSQPPHLRHLAIIRDTAVINRTSYYIHYSYENFKKLVDSGLRSWEAVAATDTSFKNKKLSIPQPDAQPEVDEYGFPSISQDTFQGQDNDATLSDCINARASKPLRSGGTTHKNAKIGDEEVSRVQIDRPVQNPHMQNPSQARDDAIPDLPVKRSYNRRSKGPSFAPNKRLIEKVGVPARFWTLSLNDREKLRQSQLSAIKYAVGKAEKEIASLTEEGGDPVAIREAVYANVDAQHIASGLKPPSEAMRAYVAGQYEQWRTQLEDEAKRDYQAKKDIQKTSSIPQPYLPSIAAHTQQYWGHDAIGTDGRARPKTIARGRLRKSDTVSLSLDSPDTATDMRTIPASPHSPQPGGILPTKRKVGRLRGDHAVTTIPYFPSIAAHTRPFIEPAHFIRRPERRTKLPSHLADSVVFDDNLATVSAVTTTKRKREPSLNGQSTKRRANRDIRLSFYENLAECLHRPDGTGVRLSNVQRDPSRRGKPNSMLAIFKCERLKAISWFVQDEPLKKPTTAYTPEELRAQAINVFERNQPRKRILDLGEHHPSPRPEQSSAALSESRTLQVVSGHRMDSEYSQSETFGALTKESSSVPHSNDAIGQARRSPDPTTQEATTPSTRTLVTDLLSAESVHKRGNTEPTVLALENVLPALNNTIESRAGLAEAATATVEHEQQVANGLLPNSDTNIQGSELNRPQENQMGSATHPDSERHFAPTPPATVPDTEVANGEADSNHGAQSNITEHNGSPSSQSPKSEAILPERETNSRTESVEEGAVSIPNAVPSECPASDNLPNLIRDESIIESDAQERSYKIQKLGPRGGSMAILRKKIILELLEQCGGAIPGDKTLETAFTSLWKKHGQDGNPDKATIKAATKSLIQTGEIRRLTFGYCGANGKSTVKSVFLTSSTSNDDPKVQQIRKSMMSCDPSAYLPEEYGIQDKHSKPSIESDHTQKVHNSHQNIAQEDTVIPHIQNKPLYLLRFEARKKAREERAQQRLNEDEEEFEDAEERRQRRQERHARAERQRIKRRLAQIRRKYPEDKRLTAFEQKELMDEYRTHYRALVSLTPNEYLTSLPAPAPLVENQTFEEFSELCLPPVSRMKLNGAVTRPVWRILEPSDMIRPHRRVERLASLKRPLPEPNINKVKLHPRRDGHRVSKSRKALRSRLAEAEEDGHQLSVTDDGGQSKAVVLTQPPWEVLQLQTVNPWNLHQMRVGNNMTTPNNFDIVRDEFIDDLDELLLWELQYVELDYTFEGAPFVNHTPLQGHQLAEHPNVDMDEAVRESWTGRDRRHTIRRLFPRKKQSMDSTDIWNITGTGAPFLPPSTSPSRSPSPVSPSSSESESSGPLRASPPQGSFGMLMLPGCSTSEVPLWLRPRRPRRPLKRKHAEMGTEQDGLENAQRPRKQVKIAVKRKKKRRRLTQDDEKRLMVAVIVIRTLTGGLDRHIDWNTVAKVFEPEFDEMVVHKAWQGIRQNYKILYEKTLFDFQEVFPSAYERGEVPAIDYEHLEDYPWARVVDWTIENLDFHTRKTFELPMDRARIDKIFTLKPISQANMASYFSAENNMNVSRRLTAISKKAFASPLTVAESPTVPSAEKQDSGGLAIAKSWIRANVVVPPATYDTQAAASKLSIFRDDVLDRAIKDLRASRVLSGQKENRIIPGRNYDLSAQCMSVLEKTLSTKTLYDATRFKSWLDEQFHSNGEVTMETISKDHEAMVLINLFSHDRIQLKPKDPPMDSWGLLNGGYETRQMDKARLKFGIHLVPTASYIYGNPLSTPLLKAPPSEHLEQKQPARIPFWYDLFGKLVPLLWDLAVVGVLGVLMQRPGVEIADIESTIQPALGKWEIELVLEWMRQIGVARREGRGWGMGEWWWCVLGAMREGLAVPAGEGEADAMDVDDPEEEVAGGAMEDDDGDVVMAMHP